jgi:hypothetical protein
MPQDLAVLNLDHLRTEGLMNSPSLEEPIRGSEDACLYDAGIGVELRGYWKPFHLQWHCPGTTVPVVAVFVLQEHGQRHFNPTQHLKLRLGNVGIGCLTHESLDLV